MPPLIVQYWLESEAGWGIRPDGVSIHKTKSDMEDYTKAYWDAMPNTVPDEYSRPTGRVDIVDVSQDIYDTIDGQGNRYYRCPDWAK